MIWKKWFSRKAEPPVTDRFQKLTDEDREIYGEPERIHVALPETDDPRCREKAANWLAWKGAPYPAERHSEYLVVPGSEDRILLSAILKTPSDIEGYLASVGRRARNNLKGHRARKAGFACRSIEPAKYSAAIHEIVISAKTRQGRPVEEELAKRGKEYAFCEYIPYGEPEFRDICMGAFAEDGSLAAYILGKRVGDHVQYDEIMAHAEHRQFNVMRLLHLEFIQACCNASPPPALLHYGPWYSGVNPYSPEGGLNKWKRIAGFKPAYLILRSS